MLQSEGLAHEHGDPGRGRAQNQIRLWHVSSRPTAAILPPPYNRVAFMTRQGVPDLSRTQAGIQHSFKDIQDPKKTFGEKEILKREEYLGSNIST